MNKPTKLLIIKILLFVIFTKECLSLFLKQTTNPAEKFLEKKKIEGFERLLGACTTLFLSGLFDRSFFITAFMAIKYSKLIVLLSAGISLSMVGIFSVFLGVAINKFIPTLYVDLFSVALFLFFGIKMIMEGLNIPKNEDLIKLEETHEIIAENQAETERENLILTENDHGNGHLTEVKKECHEISNDVGNDRCTDIKVFFKIFILIFASEIGDRSQISTIYLTNNFDKIIVISAVLISQNLLTFYESALETK